jgi:5-methylcytosine-specific restriction endonuclease McrA
MAECMSGPNNPSYNHSWTEKDRVNERTIPEYKAWRRAVYERDNCTCQVTGRRGCLLEAHHIESYDVNPDLRLDENNGVTLSREVHREFHRRYGKGRNTRAQYEEFIASFRLLDECSAD